MRWYLFSARFDELKLAVWVLWQGQLQKAVLFTQVNLISNPALHYINMGASKLGRRLGGGRMERGALSIEDCRIEVSVLVAEKVYNVRTTR